MFRTTRIPAVAFASAALFVATAGASFASAAPGTSTPGTTAPQVQTSQSDGAIFQIGTSVVNISPNKPMADGGYGSDYIVTGGVHDPLQVRAFFIGHGKQAVVFVTVDSQGWFAEYQAPNIGDGGDDARADAAAALAGKGYEVTASNIVLSSTHTHAAPTLMGLWGHTDPGYLHRVKEAAVRAVIKAAANTHEAELWSATGTIRGLVSQLQGTDQTTGYSVDTQLPILWARQPGTGATIASYSAVPVHADEYDPTVAGNNQWSADYPGFVRARLGQLLGGTNVVAVATLGRQETIGNEANYSEVEKQGNFVTNAITSALTHARPITDTTLAADNTQFSTEATNTGLLAAMSCNQPDGPLGCPGPLTEPKSNHGRGTWNWEEVGGIFTINRSLETPYFNAEDLAVGSSATVARIGSQVYATVPGEGFAEVTEAIQRTFAASPGIEATHVIDEGSDTLGYFGDYGAYPAGHMQGDLQSNNVGPNVGDDAVNAIAQDGENLGLDPASEQVTADITNPQAFSEPGIQFYSDRVETEEPTVSFYASAKAASPGVPLRVDHHRLEREHAGRRHDQLELRRRHKRTPADHGPLQPHVPGSGALLGDGQCHGQPRQHVQLDPAGTDRHPAQCGCSSDGRAGWERRSHRRGRGRRGERSRGSVDVLAWEARVRHDDHSAQAHGRARDDHGRSRQHGNRQRAHQLTGIVTRPAARTAPAGLRALPTSSPSRGQHRSVS